MLTVLFAFSNLNAQTLIAHYKFDANLNNHSDFNKITNEKHRKTYCETLHSIPKPNLIKIVYILQ